MGQRLAQKLAQVGTLYLSRHGRYGSQIFRGVRSLVVLSIPVLRFQFWAAKILWKNIPVQDWRKTENWSGSFFWWSQKGMWVRWVPEWSDSTRGTPLWFGFTSQLIVRASFLKEITGLQGYGLSTSGFEHPWRWLNGHRIRSLRWAGQKIGGCVLGWGYASRVTERSDLDVTFWTILLPKYFLSRKSGPNVQIWP